MSEFKRYTEEDIETAKSTDMLEFLSSKGYSFKSAGKGYKCREHDSLVINGDRRRWFWNSRSVGGHSAIDFCVKVEGMSFPDALKCILGRLPEQTTEAALTASSTNKDNHGKLQTSSVTSDENKPEIVLPKPEKGAYKRMFAYLCTKRKIDPQIVNELTKTHRIYQDENGNVVFLGYENDNDKPQYGSVRGTGDKQFRGDVKNSRKEVGFFIGNHNAETLHIFESPIDAMSFATFLIRLQQNQTVNKIFERNAFLSLGGTTDVALEYYLKKHDRVKKIVVCLDNDEAGITAGKKIAKKYKDKYVITRLSYSGKDLNDSLVSAWDDLKNLSECSKKSAIKKL